MNVFETCFAKKRSDIYLPEDDGEEEGCCFNFRGIGRQGLIQLPTNSQRTIVDYLSPRSLVSIQVLLQEQEEELDHYYGQTDNEDAYHGPQKTVGPLDPNFEHGQSSFFQEEVPEHRKSAILGNNSKLSGAHIPNEDDNIMGQELLDVPRHTETTSSGSISSRRFAFRKVEPEEETDAPSSLQEIAIITNSVKPYTTSLSSLSASSSTSTTSVLLPSIIHASVEQLIDGNTKYVSPVNAVELPDFVEPSSQSNQQHAQQQKLGEFPAISLTRVPYQPLLPLQISPPSTCRPHNVIKPQASSLVTTAQSIMGDKLDDFTEKLVFIKKNIIMSITNDDDGDDEDPHDYSTNRKRAGSAAKRDRNSKLSYGSSTSLPTPPPPRAFSLTNNSVNKRLANTQDGSEEEIFDLSKVVSISKTFGEGMVGIFNHLSARIKNAQQQQQQVEL